MKTTLKYCKTLVLALLAIIITFSGAAGVIFAAVGIFGALLEQKIAFLALVPAGVFFGFICVVAIDCLKYISDKWEWSK